MTVFSVMESYRLAQPVKDQEKLVNALVEVINLHEGKREGSGYISLCWAERLMSAIQLCCLIRVEDRKTGEATSITEQTASSLSGSTIKSDHALQGRFRYIRRWYVNGFARTQELRATDPREKIAVAYTNLKPQC